MSVQVTITLTLPGRSRKEALTKAGARLQAAALEDYPDRIADNRRNRNDIGLASTLAARCDLLYSIGGQMTKSSALRPGESPDYPRVINIGGGWSGQHDDPTQHDGGTV